MKLKCDCGHILVDQSDYLPHKARLAKDQDADRIWGAATHDLAALWRRGDSQPNARIAETFPGLGRSEDTVVLATYFAGLRTKHMPLVYECDNCGRLLIERAPGSNTYVSFIPSSGHVEHILRSEPGD